MSPRRKKVVRVLHEIIAEDPHHQEIHWRGVMRSDNYIRLEWREPNVSAAWHYYPAETGANNRTIFVTPDRAALWCRLLGTDLVRAPASAEGIAT